jgi:hypothetical protein
MVIDISDRLPAGPQVREQPRLLSREALAWMATRASIAARAIIPTLLIALAMGMLGWAMATAAGALNLGRPGDPVAVAVGVARWTLVAGVAQVLLRFGIGLERRRWRGEPREPVASAA